MTDHPEALRLAQEMEFTDKWHISGVTIQRAVDLLREQHAEIERHLDLAAIQSALKGIGAGADGVAADLAQQLAAKGFAPKPQRAQNRDRMRVTHRATHG